MGVRVVLLGMFLRKKKNLSGSVSIQIISKSNGKYKVVKTIGSSSNEQEILKLAFIAKQEIERLSVQSQLFISENDLIVEQVPPLYKTQTLELYVPKLFLERFTITLDLLMLAKIYLGTC